MAVILLLFVCAMMLLAVGFGLVRYSGKTRTASFETMAQGNEEGRETGDGKNTNEIAGQSQVTDQIAGQSQVTDQIAGKSAGIGTEADWRMTLVNKWNPLPENMEIETVELSNGERVDVRIYDMLQRMFDDARADGVYPIVASGYRTQQEQEEIYNSRIAEYQAEGMSYEEAKKETENWVAVPGTSEHQLGMAVDINADGIHSAGYEVYEWLEQNAHRYGFICRYPMDKTDITGVSNEPWHYRYVGEEAAEEIMRQGVCLEEYLGRVH